MASLLVCKNGCRGEITTGLWDSGADSQKLSAFYETFQSANICAQAVVYLILIWREILKISFKTSNDIQLLSLVSFLFFQAEMSNI